MKRNKALYILCILIISIYSCSLSKGEIIIIPEGYVGYIVIIYNQKNGAPEKYDNEHRVYEITSNGILKTQFAPQYGFSQLQQFYYQGENYKKQIHTVTSMKNLNHDSLVAYIGYVGNANIDSEGDSTISFSVCFVGTPSQIDSFYNIADTLNIHSLAQ